MAKALSLIAYNDLESQVEALERDGYVYFPGVLDADEIAELRVTIDGRRKKGSMEDAIPIPHTSDLLLNNLIVHLN